MPRCRCTLRSPSNGNYCCLCFLKASAASWRLSPATLQCNVVVNAGLGWRLRKPNRPSKHTMTEIFKKSPIIMCHHLCILVSARIWLKFIKLLSKYYLACTISNQNFYFIWFSYFEWKKDQLIVEQNVEILAIVLAAVVL